MDNNLKKKTYTNTEGVCSKFELLKYKLPIFETYYNLHYINNIFHFCRTVIKFITKKSNFAPSMKFRTEIDINPLEIGIDYTDKILSIGSCFASSIGAKMEHACFDTTINPTGVLFNPLSIAQSLSRYESCEAILPEEINQSRDGVWFDYGSHGSLSAQSAEQTLQNINQAIERGHRALRESNWAIITLGSAWVYRLKESGAVVANCHKQPSQLFSRELLSVSEVTSSLEGLLNSSLSGKNIIVTLSPIRHLGDGLEENGLSKATLRVAISEICRRYRNVSYFPSYEILLDDLRDYRFYAEDMVHPSNSAIEYIWHHFRSSVISPSAQSLMERVERVVKATQHRPRHPLSEEHAAFCRHNIELISSIEGVDLTAHKEYFQRELRDICKK